MEIDELNKTNSKALDGGKKQLNLIKVRAILSFAFCGTTKKFKNQLFRKNLTHIVR